VRIIAALAAVGSPPRATRDASSNSPWLRDLGERLPPSALREKGIALLSVSRNGDAVPAGVEIVTSDRASAPLIGGRPVLLLEHADGDWAAFDRKQGHGDGEGHDEP